MASTITNTSSKFEFLANDCSDLFAIFNRYTGKSIPALNLGSYNYLGFGERDSPTTQSVCDAVDKFGTSTCSTRLDFGTTVLHRQLEKQFAQFLNKEDAIIFGMYEDSSSHPLVLKSYFSSSFSNSDITKLVS